MKIKAYSILLLVIILFAFISPYPVSASNDSSYISASGDDIQVYYNGSSWTTGSGGAYAGYNSATEYKIGNGLRFTQVDIPKSATIIYACIVLRANTAKSTNTVNTVLIGEASDNATAFSDVSNYQSRRGTVVGGANNNNITSASVTWNSIGSWGSGSYYQSPNISSIIQEIVNRAGWTQGNCLVVFWDDHDDNSTHTSGALRKAHDYGSTSTSSYRPQLQVVYTCASTSSTLILRPNSDTGSWAGWSPGSDRYTYVDDSSPDESTTELATTATTCTGRFGLPNHSSETGTINSVTLFYRNYHSGTLFYASVTCGIYSHSTEYNDSARYNPAYTTNYKEWTTNPNTSSAWTWTEIDDLELNCAGYEPFGQRAYITQMFIVVDYTPAAPSLTNAPTSKAFGNVAESTTYYAYGSAPSNPIIDNECTYTITNDSTIAIDISIMADNFTGGVGWTLASNAGQNIVKMVAYKSGDNPASGVVLTNSNQAFISNLAASATKKWDFSLTTGTFTDGVAKSGKITLTSTAH